MAKKRVLGTKWLLKIMRKLYASLCFDHFSREVGCLRQKYIVSGSVSQEINVNIRIDTPFSDIHGFMNVTLVGAILSMNRVCVDESDVH